MKGALETRPPLADEFLSEREALPPGPALVLDERGRIQAGSPDATWPFSETRVGEPARAAQPEALGRLLQRLWAAAARTEAAGLVEEIAMEGPDGTMRRITVTVGLWRRRPNLYAVSVKDVTPIQEQVDELAKEVDRLGWEKRDLEEAVRGLAHDLRSPLSGLRGVLGLLAESVGPELSEKTRAILQHCRTSVECLESVLLAALQESPRRTETPRALVIHLGSTVLLELRHANPDVVFTCAIEGREASVAIPTHVLWRVLWNLAVNAVAYRSPLRPLHLVLRTWQTGDRCMIELRDNGIGLVPGEEEAIFSRGRRGSNAAGVAGTGLGLHHARTQIEDWRGQLWAEARPVGAAFLISLPPARDG